MWPGTSGKARKRNVRRITDEGGDLDHDIVVGNYKDEGAGRDDAEGGDLDHNFVMGNYKDEGAGRHEAEGGDLGHDFVVGNYKDKGAGWNVRGHDFVVSNSKGEGAGRAKEVRRIKGGGKRASRWVKVDMGPRSWTCTAIQAATSSSSHWPCTGGPWAR